MTTDSLFTDEELRHPRRPKDEVAHARRTDPQTSHDAARSVGELRPKQELILAVLRNDGPRCFDDLIARYDELHAANPAYWLRQSPSGIRTRVSELVARELVRDSVARVLLPSGRAAIVWEAVPT